MSESFGSEFDASAKTVREGFFPQEIVTHKNLDEAFPVLLGMGLA